MESKEVLRLVTMFKDKIPHEMVGSFQKALEEAGDDVELKLLSVQLIDPTMILLMAIFLGSFGVDRFLVGDTGLGVAKIFLAWMTCGIWWLVDIFKSPAKARNINLQRLLAVL